MTDGERAPTVIAYEWRQIQYSKLALPLVFVLGALFLTSLFHATHLQCSREKDQCSVDAHGFWVKTGHVDVRASDVTEMHVVELGRKNRYALATLKTKAGDVDLSGGPFLVRFAPDSARDAQYAMKRFVAGDAAFVDVWIGEGLLYFLVTIIIVLCLVAAVVIAKHDLFETFDVRIVVDHQRRVMRIARREVPLADIKDIRLEEVGRIAVETTSGEVVHATKHVGPRNMAEHQRALDLLRAAALPGER